MDKTLDSDIYKTYHTLIGLQKFKREMLRQNFIWDLVRMHTWNFQCSLESVFSLLLDHLVGLTQVTITGRSVRCGFAS